MFANSTYNPEVPYYGSKAIWTWRKIFYLFIPIKPFIQCRLVPYHKLFYNTEDTKTITKSCLTPNYLTLFIRENLPKRYVLKNVSKTVFSSSIMFLSAWGLFFLKSFKNWNWKQKTGNKNTKRKLVSIQMVFSVWKSIFYFCLITFMPD